MAKIFTQKEVAAQVSDGAIYLTVKQASQRFGLSESWFHTHREVPHIRCGKGVRFDQAELTAYFKQQALTLR